jgi:hypothetical protein
MREDSLCNLSSQEVVSGFEEGDCLSGLKPEGEARTGFVHDLAVLPDPTHIFL